MVKVGNSECEFLKLTPLSRISAIAGAVCGLTILPRRPSGMNRIRLRGAAFWAEATPADSVIRLADSNTMAWRIRFSPCQAIRRLAVALISFAVRQNCYSGHWPERRQESMIPRHDAPEFCRYLRPTRAWGMPGAQCTRSLVCK